MSELLHSVPAVSTPDDDIDLTVRPTFICRHCGAPMIVIGILE